MRLLDLTFPQGGPSLDLGRFSIREAISTPFTLSLWAVCEDPALDLRALLGKDAILRLAARGEHSRTYHAVCRAAAQSRVEPAGLSSYELTLVPRLWLLSQRRDLRIFQHRSVPDIVAAILADWQIPATWAIDRGAYPKLEMRVQYGESDLDFMSRLLEEAGIAYIFAHDDTGALVLSDAPQHAEPRPGPPIPFADVPTLVVDDACITRLHLCREVRPGAVVLGDRDPRRPMLPIEGRAGGPSAQARLEHYGHAPGASVIEGQRGGDTPVADDQGVARASEAHLARLARIRLEELRRGAHAVTFTVNAPDLPPGTVFSVTRHEVLDEASLLLVTDLALDGEGDAPWRIEGRAVFASAPFRPPRRTEKPRARGLVSAFVVGPADQEIHADEFGRVRVRFVWDRTNKRDDTTSCWLRVSHAWAGGGFGWMALPRVGQEVLVTFLDGDPDQPAILGGLHNGASPMPHPLPSFADASVWKSASTPSASGFNEILFRDRARDELVYTRTERDRTKLVRYDETVTVARDRSWLVIGDAAETTGKDRIRATAGKRARRVNGKRSARVEGRRTRRVLGKVGRRVLGAARARVGGDDHAWVHGEARIEVGGKDSLAVGGDRHEVVEKRYALEARGGAHVRSGDEGVLEGVKGVTINTPGGFVVIDAGGVTIQGALVKINSGGAAGTGAGASPDDPAPPREADRFEPPMPYEGVMPDDAPRTPAVSRSEEPEARPEVEITWIALHLVDADGAPMAGERYRVITPDGSVREGNLDAEGRARIEGVRPGTCQVMFPHLDGDEWK